MNFFLGIFSCIIFFCFSRPLPPPPPHHLLNGPSLKNSYFPIIHLPSCYRTVCDRTVQLANHIQSCSSNQPITFKVVVTWVRASARARLLLCFWRLLGPLQLSHHVREQGLALQQHFCYKSSIKDERAVHCCDPTLSVLVMSVSRNVFMWYQPSSQMSSYKSSEFSKNSNGRVNLLFIPGASNNSVFAMRSFHFWHSS